MRRFWLKNNSNLGWGATAKKAVPDLYPFGDLATRSVSPQELQVAFKERNPTLDLLQKSLIPHPQPLPDALGRGAFALANAGWGSLFLIYARGLLIFSKTIYDFHRYRLNLFY